MRSFQVSVAAARSARKPEVGLVVGGIVYAGFLELMAIPLYKKNKSLQPKWLEFILFRSIYTGMIYLSKGLGTPFSWQIKQSQSSLSKITVKS